MNRYFLALCLGLHCCAGPGFGRDLVRWRLSVTELKGRQSVYTPSGEPFSFRVSGVACSLSASFHNYYESLTFYSRTITCGSGSSVETFEASCMRDPATGKASIVPGKVPAYTAQFGSAKISLSCK